MTIKDISLFVFIMNMCLMIFIFLRYYFSNLTFNKK